MATRLLTVIGARPQFVKAAVVSAAFARHGGVEEILVHTGQHYDRNMSDVFFEELGLPTPAHNLAVGGGSHAQNTGRAMEGLEALITETRPDWVMVYGDTDSTLAGALAAAKAVVPLAHVEAGLRSFNVAMPEEVNRIVTDRLSNLLFAPSKLAMDNLEREGVPADRVRFSGDVMYDAVRVFGDVALSRSTILTDLSLTRGGYVLATLHRKENVDDPVRLKGLLDGLAKAGLPVVLPLHPRTRLRIAEQGLTPAGNLRIIDPISYFDMLALQRQAALIATDSGGVQKEAFFHGVPGAVLRDETEWPELVEHGHNVIVGADPDRIAAAILKPPVGRVPPDVYGDGQAADEIARVLAALP
ncbi:MAG: UDP-N-acetylglucosamine 2-epimerase (non-hydrolyzing) [Caulobacteraceae bacterium]|nr:UDP-N-acetylglucosamine 2-epimerase (non-hydrolyzing) [Caulobacteraceae bacterium]